MPESPGLTPVVLKKLGDTTFSTQGIMDPRYREDHSLNVCESFYFQEREVSLCPALFNSNGI